MLKDDGRLKPADPKETAEIKGKKIVCPSCGHINTFKDVEFAEKLNCSECGQEIFESHASTGRL